MLSVIYYAYRICMYLQATVNVCYLIFVFGFPCLTLFSFTDLAADLRTGLSNGSIQGNFAVLCYLRLTMTQGAAQVAADTLQQAIYWLSAFLCYTDLHKFSGSLLKHRIWHEDTDIHGHSPMVSNSNSTDSLTPVLWILLNGPWMPREAMSCMEEAKWGCSVGMRLCVLSTGSCGFRWSKRCGRQSWGISLWLGLVWVNVDSSAAEMTSFLLLVSKLGHQVNSFKSQIEARNLWNLWCQTLVATILHSFMDFDGFCESTLTSWSDYTD